MDYLVVLIAIAFSAFFSGMEIAFITANKLRIEIEKQKGSLSSILIAKFVEKPNKFISTLLLGNNIAIVIYGIAAAKVLQIPLSKFIESDFNLLIIQTLISTTIILFFAEFIPKTIFRLNPNKALNLFAIPIYLVYLIFYPITVSIIKFSELFIKYIFRKDPTKQNKKIVFSKIDLTEFINNPQQNSDELKHELEIIQNTLDFDKIKIRECIVPRNEIVAIPNTASLNELREKIAQTGYSKIPVYNGSIDNIIGYAHVHGTFLESKNLKNIIVDAPIVPESMTAKKLLNILLQKKRSLALVVDEYGGTAGIITMEDILEEIFGEIEDEHDTSEIIARQIDDTNYEFSGRIEIEKINGLFGLNITTSDDYDTLSGYILEKIERFPELNQQISIDKKLFTILKIKKSKIELVKITIIDD